MYLWGVNELVMAEELYISQGGKTEKYSLLYKQIESLASRERDTIALMANIAAMIHSTFDFWWTGFYRVAGEEDLYFNDLHCLFGAVCCQNRILPG